MKNSYKNQAKYLSMKRENEWHKDFLRIWSNAMAKYSADVKADNEKCWQLFSIFFCSRT